jgi:hypothetical protein
VANAASIVTANAQKTANRRTSSPLIEDLSTLWIHMQAFGLRHAPASPDPVGDAGVAGRPS